MDFDYALKDFPEAIDFLRSKTNLDTNTWNEAADARIQDARFTVAGAKGQLLQDLRAITEREIANGANRDDFLKDFDRILAQSGWSPKGNREWRSALILMTNLRQAYGEGRCQQMNDPDVIDARPYRMWVHGDSFVPRPHHLAMDGKVFKADHPIAQIRLPWGFGCKCTWVSLSDRDLEARGLNPDNHTQLGDLIPYKDKKGRDRAQPIEPDRGFGSPCIYETKEEREKRLAALRLDLIASLPPALIGFAFMAAIGAGKVDVITPAAGLKKAKDLFDWAGAFILPPLEAIKAAALATGGIFTVPTLLNLALDKNNKEAAKIRLDANKAVADYLREKVGQGKIDKVKEILAKRKTKQLNVIVSGANDQDGSNAAEIAKSLKKHGLAGDSLIIPNAMEEVAQSVLDQIKQSNPAAYEYITKGILIANLLGIEIKNPEDLLKIPDVFILPFRLAVKDFALKLSQASVDTSLASMEQIIDLILDNEYSQLNVLGYSAGSIVAEDITSILAELGISIDNGVTWGGVNLPNNIKSDSNFRRYFSDADFIDKAFGLPNQNDKDRFFEGVIHSPIGKSNREKIKSFPLNKKVLNQTVEDLNFGLLQEDPLPIVKIDLKPKQDDTIDVDFEILPLDLNTATTRELTQSSDLTPQEATRIQNAIRNKNGLIDLSDLVELGEPGQKIIQSLPAEIGGQINNSPLLKIPSRQDIELLRLNLKDFDVPVGLTTTRSNKAIDGTINILPKPGKTFTDSQIEQIKTFLEKEGYFVPPSFNNEAFRTGFNFIRKLETAPKDAEIVVQSFPRKLQAEAKLLEATSNRIDSDIAELLAQKEKFLLAAKERLGVGDDSPIIKDLANRLDKEIAKRQRQKNTLLSRAENYLAQAENLNANQPGIIENLQIEPAKRADPKTITVINKSVELRQLNETVNKAIDRLPQAEAELQRINAVFEESRVNNELKKAFESERKRLEKKKNQLVKNIRTIEQELIKKEQQGEGNLVRKVTTALAKARSDLAQTEAKILAADNAIGEYNQKAEVIAKFIKENTSPKKRLEKEVKKLQETINFGVNRINFLTREIANLEQLRSADPEQITLPRDQLEIKPIPKKSLPQEKRYTRRAWAERYAQQIGGDLQVTIDENGRKVYVVTPKQ